VTEHEGGILERLRAGQAFVDLSHWRMVAVGGAEALTWLDALVSADLGGLAPGRAVHSLFLSPTGRIRAEFTAAAPGEAIVLLQDPDQRSILDVLSPYVLSSDVELEDRSGRFGLFAFPARSSPLDLSGTAYSAPSCQGPGVDVITLSQHPESFASRLSESFAQASLDDLETWRILEGRPRFGVDGLDADLPQEAGLADAVSFDKGCFTGQEAVAKVRNLGHPRRLVVHLEARAPLTTGDRLVVDGTDAGELTSVAAESGRWVALGRVAWAWRGGPMVTGDGTELRLIRTL
jgi:tRNA-modifying protein YgfZ